MSNQSNKYIFEYNGAQLPLLINPDDNKKIVIERLQKRWKILKHTDLAISDLQIDDQSLEDSVNSWPKKIVKILPAQEEMGPEKARESSEDSEDSDIFKVEESSNPVTLSRVGSVSSAMNLLLETEPETPQIEENEPETIKKSINNKAASTNSNAFMKLVKKQTPKKTGPVLPVLKREEIKKELTKAKGEFGYSLKSFKGISAVFEKQGATLQ